MQLTTSAGSPVSTREYAWRDGLHDLSAPWEALVAARTLNPSLAPGWMDAAVQSQGLSAQVRLVAALDGDRLVGVVPVIRSRAWRRGVPLVELDVGSRLVAYHREIVAQPTDPGAVARVLEAALTPPWDAVRIQDVPAAGPTAAAIEAFGERHACHVVRFEGESSPFIQIDCDWNAFLRTRSKKFRANVTRALRRPAEIGAAEMTWFESGSDWQRLLADILAIEDLSWKKQAGVAITDRGFELDYHRRLLPYLAGRGMLMANVLYLDQRPAAYVLCCRADGWVGQLKTSFDARIKDAGAAVVTSSVMRAFEHQAREYDFLGHADAHKLKWTDHVRVHRGYLLFAPTVRGRTHALVQRLVDRVKRLRAPAPAATPGAASGDDN